MATTNKLQLKFKDNEGKTVSFNFNYVKANATAANIKALMNSMISNTDIWQKTLLLKASANIITTTTTAVDISE